MKQLVKMFVTILLTSFLVITICFAWFTDNDEADASDISGVVESSTVTDGFLNRYLAVSTDTDGVYTLGDNIDDDSTTLSSYDELESYDMVIYELGLTASNDTYSIDLENTDDDRDSTISYSDTYSCYVNYLSNVAEFYYLETSTSSSTEYFTVSDYPDGTSTAKYLDFSEDTSGIDSISLLSDISCSVGDSVTIYLLFDYNTENINRLYSANLGTEATENTVYFMEDLEFMLS